MPEGILRRHLYGVFGGRSEYLEATEEEVFEQRLIWKGENEAAKIQQEREAVASEALQKKLTGK